jgi:hypothetical protein
MVQPELLVEFERPVLEIAADDTNLTARIGRLAAAGWFSEPRTAGNVRSELARIGNDPGGNNIPRSLQSWMERGILAKSGDTFTLAAGVTIRMKEVA